MALTRLLQICVVVEDVEKAKRIMTDVYGFKGWKEGAEFGEPITDYTINGEPAVLDNNSRFCYCFGLEWELIEPHSGPLKKWLDEHGPGIHHLAFKSDDSYEDFYKTAKELSGKDVFLNGVSKKVGMDYSYFDLTKEIGMFVEVYNEDKAYDTGFRIDAKPDPAG